MGIFDDTPDSFGSGSDSSDDSWSGDAFGSAPDWSSGNESWEDSTGTDGDFGGTSFDSDDW